VDRFALLVLRGLVVVSGLVLPFLMRFISQETLVELVVELLLLFL
jgi:hypothetical protein